MRLKQIDSGRCHCAALERYDEVVEKRKGVVPLRLNTPQECLVRYEMVTIVGTGRINRNKNSCNRPVVQPVRYRSLPHRSQHERTKSNNKANVNVSLKFLHIKLITCYIIFFSWVINLLMKRL